MVRSCAAHSPQPGTGSTQRCLPFIGWTHGGRHRSDGATPSASTLIYCTAAGRRLNGPTEPRTNNRGEMALWHQLSRTESNFSSSSSSSSSSCSSYSCHQQIDQLLLFLSTPPESPGGSSSL
ncbi:unnamed protein product [Pleuronectes platessa]|uniref:Uncharacterized protein n=1 Tax=Pleuronectes platessa TaxID=8262 RepID=A0A9N7UWU6_PLEPL|nr:unnamed protein product [Pleuronectes platessa]